MSGPSTENVMMDGWMDGGEVERLVWRIGERVSGEQAREQVECRRERVETREKDQSVESGANLIMASLTPRS